MTEEKSFDWNTATKATLAVATVLGALFANLKSCATEQAFDEYIVESDSTTAAQDSINAHRDARVDSVVVAMAAHDELHQGGKIVKNRPVVRRIRVKKPRPWWQVW